MIRHHHVELYPNTYGWVADGRLRNQGVGLYQGTGYKGRIIIDPSSKEIIEDTVRDQRLVHIKHTILHILLTTSNAFALSSVLSMYGE